MGRSQETFGKREKEKNKRKKREDKAVKKADRKANAGGGDLDSMITYVDEFGNFTSTPPDPRNRQRIKAENIEVSVPKQEPEEEPDPNRTGVVTFFNESKGFGFIKDSVSQESIFTHINAHLEPIRENDKVAFLIEYTHKGPNAVEVKLIPKNA